MASGQTFLIHKKSMTGLKTFCMNFKKMCFTISMIGIWMNLIMFINMDPFIICTYLVVLVLN